MGLARNDFGGDDGGGRRGDCGRVLELCDLSERTEDGSTRREAARPVRFVVDVGLAILLRFLGFSKSARAFSLSDVPKNSVLVRLIPFEGEEETAVLGREPKFVGIIGGSGNGLDSTGGWARSFCGERSSAYFSRSSIMLADRRLLGILLMRFSRRDRSPCVWRA